MKTPKEYVADGAESCPMCGHQSWFAESSSPPTRGCMKISWKCAKCGSSWTDVWRIDGYIDLDPGPKVTAMDNTREDEA